ncbi:MAG: hypothetical protein KY439_02440 [Actinobacteria bacterium]|nr:hypothetical protein [Actinomycetota bacterium]
MTIEEGPEPTEEVEGASPEGATDETEEAVDAEAPPESAPGPPDVDEAGVGAEAASGAEETPSQGRLDDLQDDIDRVRARAEEEVVKIPETDTDREFIEPGTQGPVDDTIAPPG